MVWLWIGAGILGALLLVFLYDIIQSKNVVYRIYPIVGHIRTMLLSIGPELRQYIVTSNDEERPFSRDQRRWIYTSAANENNYFGFGTDNDLEESPHQIIVRHSAFPYASDETKGADDHLAPAKIMGEWRDRANAYNPKSIAYISGMSYGSLGARAVEALNRGAKLADCLHNTGEGGVSTHHQHGADLMWQIGTAYFGCRDDTGQFSFDKFFEVVERTNVKAVEIKLSQGAKPGLGGMLPGPKVTAEIARVRGIAQGKDCRSPAFHTTFADIKSLIEFIETLASETGLPVGIKSAVGVMSFWQELAAAMDDQQRGPDFITIDGGEGGTGAAPLAFSDHVAMPFKLGFSRVIQFFQANGLDEKVVFVGSGKLGLPVSALIAFGMGCDMVAVGREAMMSIGCIQAQDCHTGRCPSGVATQNWWRQRGVVPKSKAQYFANYMSQFRQELIRLSHACGVDHPSKLGLHHFEIVDEKFGCRSAKEVFGQSPHL